MHVTSGSGPGAGVEVRCGSYLHWIHPNYGTLGKKKQKYDFLGSLMETQEAGERDAFV